ncbi:ATP-binding protein [Actinacidiphila sp. ITFR-21]|uniref:ATP-binding protein n=1 Tax=Actinacidiphila sp. ITFR-21 TaxID=3075199 RepID=UPI00288AC51D|nr:ATP-binding protein [Streptomyces sp. ITFR-21]WNI19793.1 ATP-binding protein [Streptomyces sp. ITFR-21]
MVWLTPAAAPMPSAPSTFYVASIRLAAVPTAAGDSRAFVRQQLGRWELAEQTDAAELIASELVTNAVTQARSARDAAARAAVRGHHVIGVQLRATGTGLFVEVWDRSHGTPAIPRQDPDAEDGRGLLLATSLSERWGTYHPLAGGKIIWCELTRKTPEPLTAEPPPQAPDTHPRMADVELELLDMALTQRILDRLIHPPEPGPAR